MSNKFENYITYFLISLVVYVVLSRYRIVDPIITVTFFLSSIAMIFTSEQKVKDEHLLEKPEVHEYQKSRLNIYGYASAGSLVVATLIFYILTFNTSLRYGIISLALWAAMILVNIYIGNLSYNNLSTDLLTDYLAMKLKAKKINEQVIRSIVKKLIKINIDDKKSMLGIVEQDIENKQIAELFVAEYLKYVKETSGEELSSEEVSEI